MESFHMSEFGVLIQIALRNIFGSFLNLIIGGIILVGTFFFVVGSSLLSNIDTAMSRSITGSVGGHIQVYSSKSKEDLAIFNNWGFPDIAAIPDFSKIKGPLLSVENVKTVVPMGINGAFLAYGNSVDVALEKLRAALNRQIHGDHSADQHAQIESLKSHVRQMISVIQSGYSKLSVLTSQQGIDPANGEALNKAASADFWNSFDRDPLNHLEFLENKISSLVPDADFVFLSYIGTDLDTFEKSFDRMEVVDGQKVPVGHRGMLLSKYIYEQQFKIKTAHRMDQIHEALVDEGKKIAKDPDLQQLIKQNRTQTREIILQLDPIGTAKATDLLQKFLSSKDQELSKLFAVFFDTNDVNFSERYKFFYEKIAPLVELYRLRPGDMLTIKAFTKSGFVQSVNIKVYGTFQFKGLEKSGLAGGLSLMDLMSFRDLYGYMTPDRLAEMKQIEKAAGAKIVDRDKAEAELFGGSTSVTQAKEQTINDATEIGDTTHRVKTEKLVDRVYTPEEIEKGVVLNAAIILKDPSKMEKTMKEIEAVSNRDSLDLKVSSWQKAAGSIGQFVFVAKLVLYIAVFIIFIVTLVIINNAVMMATLQRIREIGTMRAIGAQRAFVLMMILIETIFLGIVFGTIGTLLGSAFIKWLGHKGIPAVNEFLYFFFSGPRLYTTLGASSIVGAFVIVLVVTTLSALYPAIIATRVSPIQAMQSED